MMVWGCVASSDDLAGATSGLKAVPVTTTVSTVLDTEAPAITLAPAAANCGAWACAAEMAPASKANAVVEERNILADIVNTPENQINTGDALSRPRHRIIAKARCCRTKLAVPVSVDADDTGP